MRGGAKRAFWVIYLPPTVSVAKFSGGHIFYKQRVVRDGHLGARGGGGRAPKGQIGEGAQKVKWPQNVS